MNVSCVLLSRNSVTCGYVLKLHFDNNVILHYQLSRSYYHSFSSCIHSFTQSGFVSRPKGIKGFFYISYSFDSDGNLHIDLPTCCGYLSKSGKWLTTGPYHRSFIVSIDDLISSLFKS